MALTIYDYILQDDILNDTWVLGGDSSEQNSNEHNYLIYAIVAFQKEDVESLKSAVRQYIARYIGEDKDCELHAKDIWNGSTRKNTPFSVLVNKAAVKEFFHGLCEVIAGFKPVIVVSCWPVESEKADHVRKGISKKASLAYSTLSRLDLNIYRISGERISNPMFFIDKECERMMMHRKGTSGVLEGLMSEVRFREFQNDIPKLKFSINPRYIPVNSNENTIVQIADLAAYFVGKHLRLSDGIDEEIKSTASISAGLYERIQDANFGFHIWQMLDIEAVGFYDGQKQLPHWLSSALKTYPEIIYQMDACNISIRESISASKNGKEFVNGTGYYTIYYIPPTDQAGDEPPKE